MDTEAKAKEMGWRPLTEFRGDPEKFVDAETFVSRGEHFVPILRKNNEKLSSQVNVLTGEVSGLKQTIASANEALQAMKEYQTEISTREYNRALKDLKEKRIEARRAGDVDAEIEAEEALEGLREAAPKPKEKVAETSPLPQAPAIHPDFAKWETDNAAWLSDPQKKAYSQAAAQFLRNSGNEATGRAFLDAVTAEVEARFGGNGSTKSPEGGNPSARISGGRTFNDLPPEAKAACDRFAERLVGPAKAYKTKEDWRKQYVSQYDWS